MTEKHTNEIINLIKDNKIPHCRIFNHHKHKRCIAYFDKRIKKLRNIENRLFVFTEEDIDIIKSIIDELTSPITPEKFFENLQKESLVIKSAIEKNKANITFYQRRGFSLSETFMMIM